TALPVITLTLKPNGYGYGTHDYTAVSDASGRYDITGIIRYVYSSGPAPKWVIYKMYISQAGYYDYVSEDISFQNVTNVIKNITISSRASEKIKTTVDNIAYRYRPLDGEPFFVREVATCKFIKTQAGKADEVTEVSLNPGERIVDRIFQALPYEGSFIFYRSDRSLSALFKAITQSNPEFDASGKLANMVISGTDHTDHPSILTRSNLTYDNLGSLIGYSAMIKTPAPNSTPTFPIYQIDDLIAKSIEYDAAGKIQTIIYIPHFHGPAETWKLSDIVYDADGDLIVWIQQKL
ncbi:MAG: hypothetical protein NT033_02215, partial [Candidatus Omnitrophica bacterium]|nr:hypothetical protein [Candidatus Omnitrophota bacterium]